MFAFLRGLVDECADEAGTGPSDPEDQAVSGLRDRFCLDKPRIGDPQVWACKLQCQRQFAKRMAEVRWRILRMMSSAVAVFNPRLLLVTVDLIERLEEQLGN